MANAFMPEFTTLYVIYGDPTDYPGKFVVRAQHVLPDGDIDYDPALVCESLDDAREVLPSGLYNLGRKDDDDPKIVEVWI